MEGKSGIESDVLIYLDNRFDSLRKEQKQARSEQNVINDKIFDLLRELKSTTDKTYQQALYTNGRVSELEKKHLYCVGENAMKQITEYQIKNDLKNSKEFRTGSFFHIFVSIVVGVSAIIVLWKTIV